MYTPESCQASLSRQWSTVFNALFKMTEIRDNAECFTGMLSNWEGKRMKSIYVSRWTPGHGRLLFLRLLLGEKHRSWLDSTLRRGDVGIFPIDIYSDYSRRQESNSKGACTSQSAFSDNHLARTDCLHSLLSSHLASTSIHRKRGRKKAREDVRPFTMKSTSMRTKQL